MNEMMRLAQERHEQIAKSIAEREADIEKLREEAEKLELFVSLAKDLFERSPQPENAPQKPASEAAEPQQTTRPDAPRIMPVRQSGTA